MRDINKKIAELKEFINGKINHPYLIKYISSPTIDEDKLLLLYAILEEVNIDEKEARNYALTTMLVQIALDTHEDVTNSTMSNSNQEHLKNRQLTVLAGDYFSGLYYYFLAQTDDIEMIRILAEAIKDINENKIKLYHIESNQIEHLMDWIEVIEASLLTRITDYFNLPKWRDVSFKFLLLKRLLRERDLFNEKGYSLVFDAMRKILFQSTSTAKESGLKEQDTYLLKTCDNYIEHLREKLMTLIPESKLKHIIEDRLNELLFIHNFPMNKIVEEG